MSRIITGDWHAHNWNKFSMILEDGRNSRFQDLLNVLDQISGYIDEYKPEEMIHLGDWTHRRHFISFSVLLPLLEKTVALCNKVGRSYFLVGNHDWEDSARYSSVGLLGMVSSLSSHPVCVIDGPSTIIVGKKPLLFVPYLPGDGVVDAVLESSRNISKKIHRAFIHYAAEGKMLESEYQLPSLLRKTGLCHIERTYFGHVHNPSEEGSLVYVGAPMHFDFGDSGPRYCVLEEDDGGIKWLPLSYPRFVTCSYPRVPAKSFDERGFLRVLGAPAREFQEIIGSAKSMGWDQVAPMEASVPPELVLALTSSLQVDRGLLENYVTEKYPDLSGLGRQSLIDWGVDCLKRAGGL